MDKLLWSILEKLINVSEIAVVLILYKNKLGLISQKGRLAVLGGVFSACLTIAMNMLEFSITVTPIITAVILFFYALFCFDSTPTNKMIWTIIASLIFVTSNSVVSIILPNNETLSSGAFTRLIGLILYVISNVTILMLLLLFKNKKEQNYLSLPLQTFMFLLAAGCISALSIQISLVLSNMQDHDKLISEMTISMVILIFVSVGIIALFYRIAIVYKQNMDANIKLAQAESEKEHNKNLKLLHDDIRGWRHDNKKHLDVLSRLLEAGDYEAIRRYLNEANAAMEDLDCFIDTGNPALDTVLSNKLSAIKKQNIHLSHTIALPVITNISSIDLCALTSNLLDNAIEAANAFGLKNTTEKAWIDVSLEIRSGMLYVQVKNVSLGYYRFENDRLLTTKEQNPEKHGMGLAKVTSIVEKNNGQILIENGKDDFTVRIVLPYVKQEVDYENTSCDN